MIANMGTNNLIQIPEYIGHINIDGLLSNIGFTLKSYDIDSLSDTEMSDCISKSIEYIIDEIISQLKIKSKVKKKVYKNGIKWELKRYECYLAVYLKNGSLSYIVRLNTINCEASNSVMYFSYGNMNFYFNTLLYKVLQDFTLLLSECANVAYAFEGHYVDTPPRGTHRDGSWFCSIHEDRIMKPMHYYDGYIDYENMSMTHFDFDTWLEDSKK